MREFFLAAAITLIACANATAQAYRWVDREGRVHYTDSPPPPDASKVEKKNFRSGGAAAPNLPYATRLAAANFPVTLYASADCGAPCDNARALLVKRAVPFREIDVRTQEQLDEVKKLSGNTRVPVLVVGKEIQSGFRDDVFNGLLDSAGYPSFAPPLPLEALRKSEPAAKAPSAAPRRTRPESSAGGSTGYDVR